MPPKTEILFASLTKCQRRVQVALKRDASLLGKEDGSCRTSIACTMQSEVLQPPHGFQGVEDRALDPP